MSVCSNIKLVCLSVDNLRTKQLMVHHGVADDNVHYQHTMLLTKVATWKLMVMTAIQALERADIQFVQHSYPDENHSLGGVSRCQP